MIGVLALVGASFFVSGCESKRNDYSEAALQDAITSLPGLASDILADYTMFSGYITVNETHGRKIFYWFVESLNDPTNDPVALWTNGGPGCSGLGGFFTEQGPFRVNDNYTLYVNNYSWVNAASMIFVEQPSGVGFSYSDTPSDYTTGDAQAAKDNYEFIKQWLTVFDNYQSNDFYITSESYGGHYMPTLAKEMEMGISKGDKPKVNFKGLFVGNPYTDPVENAKGQYDTWYGHQLVSLPTYLKWAQDCNDGKDYNSPKCEIADVLMNEEVGEYIDPYALDFPVCNRNLSNINSHSPDFFDFINYGEKFHFIKNVIHDGLHRPVPKFYKKLIDEYNYQIEKMKSYDSETFNKLFDEYLNEMKQNSKASQTSQTTAMPFDFPPDNYHACESNWATRYLNEKPVQNAIHALNTTVWTTCSYTLNYSNADSANPMEPYYQWLVDNAPDLHITVVSGDDDSVCGTLGTQSWYWNMNWTINHDYNWNPWYYTDDNGDGKQIGGFHSKMTNGVNLVTVHSAGHMIPETQPKKSLHAFKQYLQGSF